MKNPLQCPFCGAEWDPKNSVLETRKVLPVWKPFDKQEKPAPLYAFHCRFPRGCGARGPEARTKVQAASLRVHKRYPPEKLP